MAQLVESYLPSTSADEASKEAVGNDIECVLKFGAGVRASNALLLLSSYMEGDFSSITNECRKFIEALRLYGRENSVQMKLDDFNNMRESIATRQTISRPAQENFEVVSRVYSSRDITTQIQNGMNRSFQSTEESIDLTNEEGIEEEEISNTSRMSFDYLCEDSNS
ncbi:hypothetical protein JCM33374_g3666 [Metschnikowia sp. JCM 33374]|nr:hypothetical protein JCM33374_g3666 [Metschnikowia sp. JCM 33374]